MKNTINIGSSSVKTVPQQNLIDAMQPGVIYSQEQVMGLLPDHPRACVRDTLHMLVDKGIVWREGRGSNKDVRVRYSLLEGKDLRDAIDRKTTRGETPAWMQADLIGYEAENKRHQTLCMLVRR